MLSKALSARRLLTVAAAAASSLRPGAWGSNAKSSASKAAMFDPIRPAVRPRSQSRRSSPLTTASMATQLAMGTTTA